MAEIKFLNSVNSEPPVMYVTDLGNVYLQQCGRTWWDVGGTQWGGGVPRRPTSGPGSRQQGGTAARPVYSAVGLCRSRGRRGCVQGLINHGCLGRDKQSRPSRDAAAPATGGRGRGVVSQRTRWTRTPGEGGGGVLGGTP